MPALCRGEIEVDFGMVGVLLSCMEICCTHCYSSLYNTFTHTSMTQRCRVRDFLKDGPQMRSSPQESDGFALHS